MPFVLATIVDTALTVGLTAGLVLLLVAGMAVGVIFSNRRLAGSCGGSKADCVCDNKARGRCSHGDDGPAASEPLVRGARLTRGATGRGVG